MAGLASTRVARCAGANNLTYALLGDRLSYWTLFPTGGGWGRIPAWGYLRVAASRVPGIEVGRTAYGMCPMSTHVRLTPQRLTSAGFVDAADHRSRMPGVYNAYGWLDADPAHEPRIADHLLTLRPVFWLSFLVEDHLAGQGMLESGRILLLTSASSRASIGIAHLLSSRGVRTGRPDLAPPS